MHYIYKLINKVNSKAYIGYTSRDPMKRFKSHLTSARNGSMCAIHCAIRKYGDDCWTIEVLESNDDGDLLRNIREEYWIATHDHSMLYNMHKGGQGGDMSSSDNFKKFVSERLKGKPSKLKGKTLGKRSTPMSEEGRRNIAEAAKKRATKPQEFWTDESIEKMRLANLGKPKTEEAKRKMSEAAKGRPTMKCDHCGKEVWSTHHTRYHGDNCKMKLHHVKSDTV